MGWLRLGGVLNSSAESGMAGAVFLCLLDQRCGLLRRVGFVVGGVMFGEVVLVGRCWLESCGWVFVMGKLLGNVWGVGASRACFLSFLACR
ncbi:hypothetical protein [Bartonella saheliensis]|uniref:hypothetical protein n=1 Tax=Bartonella saheliensis TaxID=1457016 RepID=UPI0011A558CE|nr:hypothetical protein [Bartonella saheliensis]